VTVFEASHRIGGLWPIDKVDDGLVDPEMCLNQSRHTVSFSDFAWGEEKASFPKAWEVGEYLEGYVRKYGVQVQLKSRVVGSEMVGQGWKVHVREEEDEKVGIFLFAMHGGTSQV
jgi:cation diffusion facilitator CzcD-associated flavoprotein CzcO